MEVDHRPLSNLREEYWMIQKLGCGGFGKVYLIRHRKSREYCAAKHQRWHNQDVPRLTRREVTVLRKLVHKQVSLFIHLYQIKFFVSSFYVRLSELRYFAKIWYNLPETKPFKFPKQMSNMNMNNSIFKGMWDKKVQREIAQFSTIIVFVTFV